MSFKQAKHRVAGFFRMNASTIPIIITAVCFVAMLFLQAVTIGKQSEQLRHQNDAIKQSNELLDRMTKNSEERSKQINELQQHIDCVVLLFQRTNRSNLVIKDLESCNLKRVGTQDQPTETLKPTSSTPQTTQKPSTEGTKPSTSETPKKSKSSPGKGTIQSVLDNVINGIKNVL